MGRGVDRRRLLASGLAGAASFAVAPSALAQQAPSRQTTSPPPPADPGASLTTSLNASLDVWGRPTAEVTLNGEGPFRFRVDTGANASVVSAETIAALGLPLFGEQMVYGTTGAAPLAVTRIERLTAGSASRRNLTVLVAPPSGLRRAEGILGADVFAGQRLVFDMRAKKVELLDPRAIRFRKPPPRNMYLRNGLLAEVEGTIGRIPARFMLDTGADYCIVNPALDNLIHRTFADAWRYGRGVITGVTGVQIAGAFVALPTVRFADLTLSDAVAVAADVPIFGVWGLEDEPAMIVGVDVFSKLSTCIFDYSRHRFDAFVMAAADPSGDLLASGGDVDAA